MGKALISVLLLYSLCHADDTNQSVTFRYVKTGEFNNQGYISFGTIFWATNHTTNNFAVTLTAIENKVGTNWVIQSRPFQPLFFQPPGKPMPQLHLGPNAAGYATVQHFFQTTGTKWRAEAVFAPKLTGFPETEARIRRYPEMLRERIQYGNTNMPLNPFGTNMNFYGKSISVFSQEISEE